MDYRTKSSSPCCFGNALSCRGPRYDRPVGTHTPRCGGRCLLTSDSSQNTVWVTTLLLLVPALSWELLQKQDVLDLIDHRAPLLVYLELGLVFLFLTCTYLTEPGILETVSYTSATAEDPEEHVKIILFRSTLVDLPVLRAKFSRYTNNCIENFDHYCPWVGNAVGIRNYRYFYAFILSSLVLGSTVTGFSAVLLYREAEKTSAWTAVKADPAATLIGLYGAFMTFSLLWLVGLHTYAVSKNLTTNEIIKGTYVGRVNPNDGGCCVNWARFLCRPIGTSRLLDVHYYRETNIEDMDPILRQLIAQSDENRRILLPGSITPTSGAATHREPFLSRDAADVRGGFANLV